MSSGRTRHSGSEQDGHELAHLGKPAVETLTTVFGGYAFGWIAWRTRSFLYPVLIHAGITTAVIMISAA